MEKCNLLFDVAGQSIRAESRDCYATEGLLIIFQLKIFSHLL